MQIDALYAGKITSLQPDGERTGIYKTLIDTAEVNKLGLVEDNQADLRVHGGEEKAVHQYAVSNYSRITAAYPQLEGIAVPGSLGENLSCAEMDEKNVFLGDIYRAGTVLLQVSQPRNPCWKINHRFGVDSLAKFVMDEQVNGWYYRVLEDGMMKIGDNITLEQRMNTVSVFDFLTVKKEHRPTLYSLDALLACQGLAPELIQRLQERRKFIAEQK